jgi:hypothetical protein
MSYFDYKLVNKLSSVPDNKLKQLQFEVRSWKRMLAFIMTENVNLKNRLSEILKERFSESMLEDIESFHYKFLKQDELISVFRNDLANLDSNLDIKIFNDNKTLADIIKQMNKLRHNLNAEEIEFIKLKTEFNNYLLEKL